MKLYGLSSFSHYIFQYISLFNRLLYHCTMSVKQCHYRFTFRANLTSLSASLCLTDVLVCLPSIPLSPPLCLSTPLSARDVLGLLIRWVCLQHTIAHIPETSAHTINKYPKKYLKHSHTLKDEEYCVVHICYSHGQSYFPLDRLQKSESILFASTFRKHAI